MCSSDLDKLKFVKLPDLLEQVGDYAFYNCKSLEGIVFPDLLKSIGVFSFSNTKLKNIIIRSLSAVSLVMASLSVNFPSFMPERNIFIIKTTRNKMIPMVILKRTHIPHIVNNIINEK